MTVCRAAQAPPLRTRIGSRDSTFSCRLDRFLAHSNVMSQAEPSGAAKKISFVARPGLTCPSNHCIKQSSPCFTIQALFQCETNVKIHSKFDVIWVATEVETAPKLQRSIQNSTSMEKERQMKQETWLEYPSFTVSNPSIRNDMELHPKFEIVRVAGEEDCCFKAAKVHPKFDINGKRKTNETRDLVGIPKFHRFQPIDKERHGAPPKGDLRLFEWRVRRTAVSKRRRSIQKFDINGKKERQMKQETWLEYPSFTIPNPTDKERHGAPPKVAGEEDCCYKAAKVHPKFDINGKRKTNETRDLVGIPKFQYSKPTDKERHGAPPKVCFSLRLFEWRVRRTAVTKRRRSIQKFDINGKKERQMKQETWLEYPSFTVSNPSIRNDMELHPKFEIVQVAGEEDCCYKAAKVHPKIRHQWKKRKTNETRDLVGIPKFHIFQTRPIRNDMELHPKFEIVRVAGEEDCCLQSGEGPSKNSTSMEKERQMKQETWLEYPSFNIPNRPIRNDMELHPKFEIVQVAGEEDCCYKAAKVHPKFDINGKKERQMKQETWLEYPSFNIPNPTDKERHGAPPKVAGEEDCCYKAAKVHPKIRHQWKKRKTNETRDLVGIPKFHVFQTRPIRNDMELHPKFEIVQVAGEEDCCYKAAKVHPKFEIVQVAGEEDCCYKAAKVHPKFDINGKRKTNETRDLVGIPKFHRFQPIDKERHGAPPKVAGEEDCCYKAAKVHPKFDINGKKERQMKQETWLEYPSFTVSKPIDKERHGAPPKVSFSLRLFEWRVRRTAVSKRRRSIQKFDINGKKERQMKQETWLEYPSFTVSKPIDKERHGAPPKVAGEEDCCFKAAKVHPKFDINGKRKTNETRDLVGIPKFHRFQPIDKERHGASPKGDLRLFKWRVRRTAVTKRRRSIQNSTSMEKERQMKQETWLEYPSFTVSNPSIRNDMELHPKFEIVRVAGEEDCCFKAAKVHPKFDINGKKERQMKQETWLEYPSFTVSNPSIRNDMELHPKFEIVQVAGEENCCYKAAKVHPKFDINGKRKTNETRDLVGIPKFHRFQPIDKERHGAPPKVAGEEDCCYKAAKVHPKFDINGKKERQMKQETWLEYPSFTVSNPSIRNDMELHPKFEIVQVAGEENCCFKAAKFDINGKKERQMKQETWLEYPSFTVSNPSIRNDMELHPKFEIVQVAGEEDCCYKAAKFDINGKKERQMKQETWLEYPSFTVSNPSIRNDMELHPKFEIVQVAGEEDCCYKAAKVHPKKTWLEYPSFTVSKPTDKERHGAPPKGEFGSINLKM
ncbi:unnamed protein product [Caenorhabditis auriculariae]|uniref:Uncharacterized protein n=1 Tax=Caenorhabditis auriculariae TaxID=2777116 RepID=A0A8S1H5X8_9PELO|nr:unnamed protein product [Caenorhabditis auriculariae]